MIMANGGRPPMMMQNGGVSPGGSVMVAPAMMGNGSFSMPSGQLVPASGQLVAAPAYGPPPMTNPGTQMFLAGPPMGPQMGSSIALSGGGSPMAMGGMPPGFGAIMSAPLDIDVGEEGRTTLPVRVRDTQDLDSAERGTLPAGTNFTVTLAAGRRILITAPSEGITGWISTRSQEGQPLIAKFGPPVGMPVMIQQQAPPPFRPQSMPAMQQHPQFQPRPAMAVYAAAPPPMVHATIDVPVSSRQEVNYNDAPPESARANGGGWLSWFQQDIAFDGAKGVDQTWTRRHGMMEFKNGQTYAATPAESPQLSPQHSPYTAQAPVYVQPTSSIVMPPQQMLYRPGSAVMMPPQQLVYAGR